MAQLVASISGVVLGGVIEAEGCNLAGGEYLQHLEAQLIYYISLYIYKVTAYSDDTHAPFDRLVTPHRDKVWK